MRARIVLPSAAGKAVLRSLFRQAVECAQDLSLMNIAPSTGP
jgi:hypothetical protein